MEYLYGALTLWVVLSLIGSALWRRRILDVIETINSTSKTLTDWLRSLSTKVLDHTLELEVQRQAQQNQHERINTLESRLEAVERFYKQ